MYFLECHIHKISYLFVLLVRDHETFLLGASKHASTCHSQKGVDAPAVMRDLMQREAPYPELLTFHADASHSERGYGNVPKKVDREWSSESARNLSACPFALMILH